ncbi:MAG: SLATT domain-containing protein [Deltaproteobacteria bacterium]|nr:SLATT domain-containing protein [Deltaproteobacteria bacterium]
MRKEDLLKQIADTAYNVGFGAKKHFATYDIVEKAPGWIGFVSMGIGVFALFIEVLATKHMAAILIVLGISGLLINLYNETKQTYEQKGVFLTKLFNELKSLYFSVKALDKSDFTEEAEKLSEIESRYYSNCISKQILFSDWYAHYKFFWQHQIDWVEEQKHFKFWRDKVPLSFVLVVSTVLVALIALVVWK